MKNFFKELFEYNNTANQKFIEVFESNASIVTDRAANLFSHILNVHQIWNNRIEPRESLFDIWKNDNIQDYSIINKNNFEHSISIIDNHDLTELIKYTNTKGQIFYNSIKDIFFHVINHSTYHRAQIIVELKQKNIEPVISDYILYKR